MQVLIDFETRSEVDLKEVGAYNYATHPSTRVLCMGYKIDDEPTQIWKPWKGEKFPGVINACIILEAIFTAHNALFDSLIYEHVVVPRIINFARSIPVTRWRCTAAKAAAHALPRNLAGAGHALGLETQKDKEGHRLMLKWCKPRKPSKNNPSKWANDPDEFERICEYCVTDIDTTYLLDKALPDLKESEQELWFLDQKINRRGIHVDVPLVKTALNLIDQETKLLNAECEALTLGCIDSATKRAKILEWVTEEGYELPNLQAKTIRDALRAGDIRGVSKRLLEIRASVSKTSTAKYISFLERANPKDQRVRDLLLFCGAGPGRWTGMGIQPQNFPRGTIKDVDFALEVLALGDLELVRMLWGDPMTVLSSCLRGMITAPPGEELFCADFSAIEARVLFWLAGHKDGVKAFEEGRDLYRQLAAIIFDIPEEDVTDAQRDLGKRGILGCGYQMGPAKFKATCESFDSYISDELAEATVQAFRSLHWPVKQMWSNMERAAILATTTGKAYSINKVKWFKKGKFLHCELPSGRRLSYYGPEVKNVKMNWGETKPCLFHWGTNPVTKQWEFDSTYGGCLVENICQGTARDFMAEAMTRIDVAGFSVSLTVHDEVLASRQAGQGDLKEFERLMSYRPQWGKTCPIAAKGWSGYRYKKG